MAGAKNHRPTTLCRCGHSYSAHMESWVEVRTAGVTFAGCSFYPCRCEKFIYGGPAKPERASTVAASHVAPAPKPEPDPPRPSPPRGPRGPRSKRAPVPRTRRRIECVARRAA